MEALQSVALAGASSLSVDEVLQRITSGLAAQPGVALSRIWLLRPGDICNTCHMRQQCPDQSRCLHLVASEGNDRDGNKAWTGLDGFFRRFPLGVRKVGRIGAEGSPLLVGDIGAQSGWIVRPEWAQAEGIRSFAGQPLIFRDEVLGVLAVFSRETIDEAQLDRLRVFADHAAVGLANARAFEEIDRLRSRLEEERDYLRDEIKQVQAFGDIIGESDSLRAVLQQIELVAPTGANVLILGESGTGKELVARAIHERSSRGKHPMVGVNCASIPRELFESEFFGHVKGAFTGALRDRTGRFQLAHGGTLFLDEVGEIPAELQGKLLRVLQEGQFERLGEDRTREVDVRLIAATNRDLKQEVDAGRFRRDLYYRVSVFPIELPPLRDRQEDIVPLARHFLRLCSARMRRQEPKLQAGDVKLLRGYDWPGNIRELQNVIDRAVILAAGDRLRLDEALPGGALPGSSSGSTEPAAPAPFATDAEMRRREKQNLQAALKAAGGKVYGVGGAAKLLGMKPSTLVSRMRAMGIKKPA